MNQKPQRNQASDPADLDARADLDRRIHDAWHRAHSRDGRDADYIEWRTLSEERARRFGHPKDETE